MARIAAILAVLACVLALAGPRHLAEAAPTEDGAMKRRPQGILTGMPFMSNLASRTFVDDLDRKIYLANVPSRIVSLAPSVTEMLYAIGAGDQIVGVTPFCDYPPEAKQKPKIGYIHPSLEAVITLRPDLILAPHEFIRADLLGKLEHLKIPVFILDAKRIEDIPSHVQMLGRMLGRGADADRTATEIRRKLSELKGLTQELPRPRVLYVLNSEPLISVGPGSFIHQLIELAGGRNIATEAGTAYPRLSMEQVLAQDPELIIFPVGTAEGIPEAEQARWRRWTTMTAVKRGAFKQIEGDLLNRPGPRIVVGLVRLIQLIHPDVVTPP